MADSGKRTVVIAMDGSLYSDYAFDWYTQNATKENDEVLIITCLDNHGCTAYMRRNSSTDEIRKQLQQDMDIHTALEEHLQLKLTNAGLNGSVFSCYGKPGEAIINAAKEKHASVIICGSRGHGKLRRTIMGSISSYLVHHSDIPVIVCRHKDHHHHHHDHPHHVHIDSPSDVSNLLHGH
ncbi:universal stress protein YxiE-like [Mytilus trossulus]|uniref:universal stress protein YxiE-like n=1 Tax=Mytilus trossulus TaxID=6551 RepID=UPI003006D56C